MEGIRAVHEAITAGRPARELHGCLDRFPARIGEDHPVEPGRIVQQPLGQDAGQRRNVHLHKVGKIAREDARQRVAKAGMVAADAEHAPAAQQIEVTRARAVKQVLTGAAAKAEIVADGTQHAYHRLVHMARMQCVALRLAFREQRGDVAAGLHNIPVWLRLEADCHR